MGKYVSYETEENGGRLFDEEASSRTRSDEVPGCPFCW